jgi:predicted enzyme related to lactoylglutathione lyase
VDAVTLAVPDLDAGLEFYMRQLGHTLLWRNDEIGQAGLGCPDSDTEIVLTTDLPSEPTWLVESVESAVAAIAGSGGRVLNPPRDIPVGSVAVVEDLFGNRLVLVDLNAGRYSTDGSGSVTRVDRG